MNKNVSGKVSGGSPNLDAVSPGAVSEIGAQVVRRKPAEPLSRAKETPVAMGNAKALDVGRGGPGAGRDVHQCGSQGRHGGSNE